MRMRSPGKEAGIPVALSLCSLRNRMDNPLLAVRDITHKYIVVEGKNNEEKKRGVIVLVLTAIITVFLCYTAAVGLGPTGTGSGKKVLKPVLICQAV